MTREQAQRAIRDCSGRLTLLGVIGSFRCGCCDEKLPQSQYAGGVWCKDDGGGLLEHFLVCRDCYEKFCEGH